MKKIVLFLTLVLSLTAYAQKEVQKKKNQQASPEEKAQRSVNHLDKKVGLSETQKPKIYDLALARAKKMEEIKSKYKPKKNPDDRVITRKEVQQCRKDYREGVKQVLTQEQKDKLKAKAKEKKEARKEGIDKVQDKMETEADEKADDLDKAIEIED
jgi:Spy/CpxP family protein refolding chaperone